MRIKNFNPPSRKGSDAALNEFYQMYEQISIHTPARGVTALGGLDWNLIQISIHTPARGVTAIFANNHI